MFHDQMSSQQTRTSLRRLQDLLKRSRRLLTKQDVVRTSDLRRPEGVWLTSFWDVQFKKSWKRLIYDVSRTSGFRCLERLIFVALKTSNLQRLEDVWFMASWRRLIYSVLKTSVKRRLCSNVVATSIQRQKKLFFLILYCLKCLENFKFSSLG